jgi:hypothetical protein
MHTVQVLHAGYDVGWGTGNLAKPVQTQIVVIINVLMYVPHPAS